MNNKKIILLVKILRDNNLCSEEYFGQVERGEVTLQPEEIEAIKAKVEVVYRRKAVDKSKEELKKAKQKTKSGKTMKCEKCNKEKDHGVYQFQFYPGKKTGSEADADKTTFNYDVNIAPVIVHLCNRCVFLSRLVRLFYLIVPCLLFFAVFILLANIHSAGGTPISGFLGVIYFLIGTFVFIWSVSIIRSMIRVVFSRAVRIGDELAILMNRKALKKEHGYDAFFTSQKHLYEDWWG